MIYAVYCPELGQGLDDARHINETSPADAAKQWALINDYEDACYHIANGHDCSVVVNNGESELHYIVSGESVPHYVARLKVARNEA